MNVHVTQAYLILTICLIYIVRLVVNPLKAEVALEGTNVHVTQRYLAACLWNVNFVVSFFIVLALVGTNVHVTQACLGACLWNVNFVVVVLNTKVSLHNTNKHVA